MRHHHAIMLTAALALIFSNAVAAQAVHGAMGAQARASVRITVSVVPRFRLNGSDASGATANTAIPPDGVAVSSNAGVRYALVIDPTEPRDPRSAANGTKPGPTRLLVVPD